MINGNGNSKINNNVIIEVKNLCVSYEQGKYAIKDISFSIKRGDFLALIGPNGGGKTTLIKAILGLVKPSLGEVRLFGKSIKEFKEWYKIGYVPQDVISRVQFFPVSVYELLKSNLVKRDNEKDKIYEALSLVNLKDFVKYSIAELSGGQLQRLFIARVLINEPECIIFDEPTVFIDQSTQTNLYKILSELNRDRKVTMIITSHDVSSIINLVNKLACINKTLFHYGFKEDLFENESLCNLYGYHVFEITHKHNWQ